MARSNMKKRLVLRMQAGVVDSGSASLANFLVGLVATRILDSSTLGVYAVFYTAFGMASQIPKHLVLAPAEVAAVRYPEDQRLGQLPQSLRLGLIPAMVAILAVGFATAVTGSQTTGNVLLAMSLTAAVASFVSPLQDHVRQMLHIAGISWHAASISVVQVVAMAVALFSFTAIDLPPEWVPFSALATANSLSLATGFAIAKRKTIDAPPERLRLRSLLDVGQWYALWRVAPAGGKFITVAIITQLAGTAALGYAEAARVVASPLMTLGTGFMAVLSPRSMEAAVKRDSMGARRIRRGYQGVMALAVLLYLAIVAGPWAWNPMTRLVPVAYTVGWLVVVAALSNLASVWWDPYRAEMMGGGLQKRMVRVSMLTAPLQLAVAATAGMTGAFARPLSNLAVNVATAIGLRLETSRLYWRHAR